MKYLEVIELRTSQENHSLFEQYLAGWVEQVKTDKKVLSIKIYKHLNLETDFSIHLHHDLKIKNFDLEKAWASSNPEKSAQYSAQKQAILDKCDTHKYYEKKIDPLFEKLDRGGREK